MLVGGITFLLHSCGSDGDSMAVDILRTQQLQGRKMMSAAREYISNRELRYDDQYFSNAYPPDNIGVCTDVVWKALESIGVDLKLLMDEEIGESFYYYEDIIAVQDPNIDFRLVPQMERFLRRNAIVLTNDVDDIMAWQPGDIVTFESSHVAIVSRRYNIWGRPFIIQHGKDPAAEEDRIFASDGMVISGHFRWPLASGKKIKVNQSEDTEREDIYLEINVE